MFRWLTDQYPNINRRLSEGLTIDTHVDNFYLDMNGIIHPCTHGNAEGKVIVLDETAMFKKIFLYVDRLYKLVQPSECLYLAVDGVAPRAKMNQQRARRFRSAKEAEENAATVLARDGKLPEGKQFDSNCITPGTDFMLKLSFALRKWVDFKMKNDPFWASGASVVVTGPDVPGEGEHKVMDFIREEKEKYEAREAGDLDGDETILWGPEWTHVLYGLDADLIMLGLVTHEPNFLLLREKMSVVMAGRGRSKNRKKKDMLEYDQNDFELLELRSLRELLSIQFRKFSDKGTLTVDYDLNRVIDDFVFMCMLVGNDFLAHSPHLEIDNGAISIMMTTYVDLLPEWGDYLTDKEMIHPKRFEQFMYNLAYYEEEHFKRRGIEEQEPGWQLSAEIEDEEEDFYGIYYGGKPTPPAATVANVKGDSPTSTSADSFENLNGDIINGGPTKTIRSYRDFYYATKLRWSRADKDATLFHRRAHVRDYLEGLHWVLNYYHRGCMSWDWFFPHLYAPLSTDMVNLDEFYEDDCPSNERGFKAWKFDKGTPFPSLGQLLSVLPPQSADLLPKPIGQMMLEPFSPIIQYYPADFESDPNGKRQLWEAIVKIPFIDSGILLDSLNEVIQKDEAATSDEDRLLSNGERLRNVPGRSHLFSAPNRGAPERKAIEAQAFARVAGPVRQSRPPRTRRPPTNSRNPRRPAQKRRG
eukprot:CAMPEP_0194204872 /NCGR_PEP_ID=MMETSP0156-20130528/4284_1 /TAXON_ID=33649 /ORGANISM="Thalassionema nitzschioides, Strain L26-B" /LENGTH=697 /DNA_ID=CAMNT_0038930999 /DNA_START=211 /DNA_END=2304 /DNA_ORIENTATION=+